MVKRSRLEVSYDFDFRLIGIIAKIKDYKLAWALNRQMHLHLVKEPDHVLDFKQEQRLVISHFSYLNAYTGFRLMKNKAEENSGKVKPFLLPELKQYEYLLLVYGEPDDSDMKRIQEHLKMINWVQYAKEEDLQNLRSKDNLIL